MKTKSLPSSNTILKSLAIGSLFFIGLNSCTIQTGSYTERDGVYYDPNKDTIPEGTVFNEDDWQDESYSDNTDNQNRRNDEYDGYRPRPGVKGKLGRRVHPSPSSDWGVYTGEETIYSNTGSYWGWNYPYYSPYWTSSLMWNSGWGWNMGLGWNSLHYWGMYDPFYSPWYSPYYFYSSPYYYNSGLYGWGGYPYGVSPYRRVQSGSVGRLGNSYDQPGFSQNQGKMSTQEYQNHGNNGRFRNNSTGNLDRNSRNNGFRNQSEPIRIERPVYQIEKRRNMDTYSSPSYNGGGFRNAPSSNSSSSGMRNSGGFR